MSQPRVWPSTKLDSTSSVLAAGPRAPGHRALGVKLASGCRCVVVADAPSLPSGGVVLGWD